MKCRAYVALVAALGCIGCGSGIDVTRVSSSESTQTGVPWNLPMTQYTLLIKRQIKECDGHLKGSA